jgi:hypothetical protein
MHCTAQIIINAFFSRFKAQDVLVCYKRMNLAPNAQHQTMLQNAEIFEAMN